MPTSTEVGKARQAVISPPENFLGGWQRQLGTLFSAILNGNISLFLFI